MTTQKDKLIASLMKRYNLTFSDIAAWEGKQHAETEKALIADARTYHRDGELEFDDNPVVSRGDDPGAYVMCWRWVYD